MGGPPEVLRAFDTNGDSRLSVGDTLELKLLDDATRPNSPFRITTVEVTQDVADQFNQVVVEPPQIPDSITARGASIGQSLSGETISNDRIVTIEGRNYSVGFLKQQADSYADSSFSLPPLGGSEAQVNIPTAWGFGSVGSSVREFEAYISETFPTGDPDVPANLSVRYEGSSTLIVDGQTYIPSQIPPGTIAPGGLSISTNLDSDFEAARELVNSFSEVQIVTEFPFIDAFAVKVPADYLTQWRRALLDNLPAGSSVNFERGISSDPGAQSAPTA